MGNLGTVQWRIVSRLYKNIYVGFVSTESNADIFFAMKVLLSKVPIKCDESSVGPWEWGGELGLQVHHGNLHMASSVFVDRYIIGIKSI
jgi:hypothetical protein